MGSPTFQPSGPSSVDSPSRSPASAEQLQSGSLERKVCEVLEPTKNSTSGKTGDDFRLLVVGSGSGVVDEWDMEGKKWTKVFSSWNQIKKKTLILL